MRNRKDTSYQGRKGPETEPINQSPSKFQTQRNPTKTCGTSTRGITCAFPTHLRPLWSHPIPTCLYICQQMSQSSPTLLTTSHYLIHFFRFQSLTAIMTPNSIEIHCKFTKLQWSMMENESVKHNNCNRTWIERDGIEIKSTACH